MDMTSPKNLTDASDEQPENAQLPIRVVPREISIASSDVQPQNAPSAMEARLLGNSTLLSDVQREKAASPMDTMPSGIRMDVRDEQR